MGFQGREFAFDSPAAAVAGLIARAVRSGTRRSSETLALDAALGRVLAEPIVCDRDSPAFDYSAMDGYAVRSADVHAAEDRARASGTTAVTLRVVGESRIGREPPTLAARAAKSSVAAAMRIATGAPMPSGAEAVIRREDVVEHVDSSTVGVGSITLPLEVAANIKAGDYVRLRGENAHAGSTVLSPGAALTTASLGALAAVGCIAPRVYRRLRVALITTGDELTAPSATPGFFQVRDSNAVAIAAMLRACVWLEVVSVMHLDDDADLTAALRAMIGADEPETRRGAEGVILTGGVSMGHRDPVRAAVESLGAEIVCHGLPQRPGMPMLAAVLSSRVGLGVAPVPIFGLPGNPVSAMVTGTRIVLPVLAACAGAVETPAALAPRLVELAVDGGKRLNMWWHRPARLVVSADGTPLAELIDTRGSGDVVAAARSDGFVEIAPAGASVRDTTSRVVPFYSWPA